MRSKNKPGGLPAGRQGYIAIIASVVVTTIVGVVALVFSSSNFLGRYDTLALEHKEISRALAEGCMEYARLQLTLDPAYGGGETVPIASSTCTVGVVVPAGDNLVIPVSAATQGKWTNLTATVRSSDLAIVSLTETP